ncbi:calcium/calmodulin-dependent protein kinase type 1 [Aphelenchoides avenae]|nr:calcium/calmodulin-dependent protein kinase type 1 [Aphelenchus avenae]
MREVWEKVDVMVFHDVECAFYEAVVGVEDFPLPKVWYTRKNSRDEVGVILMEDLSSVGCKTGFTQSMTAQQLRNITRHFAALHAYHICADGEQKAKIDAIPDRSAFFAESQESMLAGLVDGVKEAKEGMLAGLVNKLKPTGTSKFVKYAFFERPKELGIPLVLCQGDSGGHNMFFKKAHGGTVSNEVCAFLDWQIAFKGNPFCDIAKLAVGFADAEVRREVEASLVEDYYKHLENGVAQKAGRKLSFGVEQLREAYMLCRAQSALWTLAFLAFLPIILKDKVSPGVLEALREKSLIRVKFALIDAEESLKNTFAADTIMTVDVAVANILQGSPNAPLAESGLTAGWLVQTLLNFNQEFKQVLGDGKVEETDTKDISEGEGFASRVYKVVLKLSNAGAEEHAVIMKVPTREKLGQLGEDLNKNGAADAMKEVWDKIDIMDFHDVECAFYEAVRNVDDVPLPNVWYTRKNSKDEVGVILMEDLSSVGCKTVFIHSMTAQQLRNITRHFAALHAYHLCASDEQNAKIDAIPDKSEFFAESQESLLAGLVAGVKEAQEGVLADLVKKLKPTGTSKFVKYAFFERPKELGIPPLLCQGDSGGHNLFFKKASDGTVSNEVCAFLDWQVAFKGNPFYDIARIVVSFSDAEVRREVEADLVEDYYEHLKKGLEKRGGKKLGFGLEQLREAYELSKAHSAMMTIGWIVFIPIIAKDKVSPSVMDALREKALVRGKLALADGVDALKKYAPQFLLRETYELNKAHSAWMSLGWIPLISVIAKDKVSPSVMDALHEKALMRGQLSLADGVEALKKYAPQFLME